MWKWRGFGISEETSNDGIMSKYSAGETEEVGQAALWGEWTDDISDRCSDYEVLFFQSACGLTMAVEALGCQVVSLLLQVTKPWTTHLALGFTWLVQNINPGCCSANNVMEHQWRMVHVSQFDKCPEFKQKIILMPHISQIVLNWCTKKYACLKQDTFNHAHFLS